MRLTLRTLLSYLDDMLEPSQARVIGQKAADSDAARELMERIKQVTRKRRLTTPPQAGSGAIDANTIAEYLDNVVSPEQAAEVEQICLASDVHLAEVAGCHQILTLVLGEPAVVPPSANQRMYGLVKGPESIPFRKPASLAAPPEMDHSDHRDQDETLRLGMAPVGKSGLSNRLILIGGGMVAACLLVVALWQVLNFTGKDPVNKSGDKVVQVDPNKDKPKDINREDKNLPSDKTDPDKKDPDKTNPDKADPEKKSPEDLDKKKTDKGEVVLPPPPVVVEIPFGPVDGGQTQIGQLVPLETKEPSVLLQATPEGKSNWERLEGKNNKVISSRRLVGLPGIRSQIRTKKGLDLIVWGSAPELYFPIDPKKGSPSPCQESVVELHHHDVLALEVTLHRGRFSLSNPTDKAAMVRVRYQNPAITKPENATEFLDITLEPKSAMLVELFSFYSPSEAFFKDAKDPNRLGPNSLIYSFVLQGAALLKSGDLTFSLSAPPGLAMIGWNSAQGLSPPQNLPSLPFAVEPNHLAKKGGDPEREEFIKARDFLAGSLVKKSVDVAIEEALKTNNLYLRRLALRCRAALDDLPSLVDALDQKDAQDLRRQANKSLEDWIAGGRENDYLLFNYLKTRFKTAKNEPEIIMSLLHPVSPKNQAAPETYEQLIDCLVNSSLVIRELGYNKLVQLVPWGANIPYSAAGSPASREAAVNAWRGIIPPGRLPIPPMPTKK